MAQSLQRHRLLLLACIVAAHTFNSRPEVQSLGRLVHEIRPCTSRLTKKQKWHSQQTSGMQASAGCTLQAEGVIASIADGTQQHSCGREQHISQHRRRCILASGRWTSCCCCARRKHLHLAACVPGGMTQLHVRVIPVRAMNDSMQLRVMYSNITCS